MLMLTLMQRQELIKMHTVPTDDRLYWWQHQHMRIFWDLKEQSPVNTQSTCAIRQQRRLWKHTYSRNICGQNIQWTQSIRTPTAEPSAKCISDELTSPNLPSIYYRRQAHSISLTMVGDSVRRVPAPPRRPGSCLTMPSPATGYLAYRTHGQYCGVLQENKNWIQTLLRVGFEQWLSTPDVPLHLLPQIFSPRLQDIIQQQNAIEWRQLFKNGRFSTEWSRVQQAAFDGAPSSGNNKIKPSGEVGKSN